MVTLKFLGGAREVGRSCIEVCISENAESLLMDAGVSLGAHAPDERFPYDPTEKPKYIIGTHAHLDHVGHIPVFAKKYQAKVLATPPTQDISELLFLDMLKLEKEKGAQSMFESKDITKLRKMNIDVRYGVPYELTIDENKVKMIMFKAGHILGSAMVHLDINNEHKILYTGDFYMGNTRTIQMADTKLPKVKTLIIESTYSSPNDRRPGRDRIEKDFVNTLRNVYKRGGKSLVAAFAVGRAQEVQLVLEAYMRSNALPKMKVFLGGLVLKVNKKYKLFWEWLKPEIQKQIRYTYRSPLDSKIFIPIRNKKDPLRLEEPFVIVAPSGMLQGGLSLYYFKQLAENPKNAIILTGYQVPGTIGRKLLDGEKRIKIGDEEIEVKAEVKNFEFSAHSDFSGLFKFVVNLKESLENIILVHGEEWKQKLFAKKLEEKLRNTNIYIPRVNDEIEI